MEPALRGRTAISVAGRDIMGGLREFIRGLGTGTLWDRWRCVVFMLS